MHASLGQNSQIRRMNPQKRIHPTMDDDVSPTAYLKQPTNNHDGAVLSSMDSTIIATTHAHHAFPTQDNPANAYIIYQTLVLTTMVSATKPTRYGGTLMSPATLFQCCITSSADPNATSTLVSNGI